MEEKTNEVPFFNQQIAFPGFDRVKGICEITDPEDVLTIERLKEDAERSQLEFFQREQADIQALDKSASDFKKASVEEHQLTNQIHTLILEHTDFFGLSGDGFRVRVQQGKLEVYVDEGDGLEVMVDAESNPQMLGLQMLHNKGIELNPQVVMDFLQTNSDTLEHLWENKIQQSAKITGYELELEDLAYRNYRNTIAKTVLSLIGNETGDPQIIFERLTQLFESQYSFSFAYHDDSRIYDQIPRLIEHMHSLPKDIVTTYRSGIQMLIPYFLRSSIPPLPPSQNESISAEDYYRWLMAYSPEEVRTLYSSNWEVAMKYAVTMRESPDELRFTSELFTRFYKLVSQDLIPKELQKLRSDDQESMNIGYSSVTYGLHGKRMSGVEPEHLPSRIEHICKRIDYLIHNASEAHNLSYYTQLGLIVGEVAKIHPFVDLNGSTAVALGEVVNILSGKRKEPLPYEYDFERRLMTVFNHGRTYRKGMELARHLIKTQSTFEESRLVTNTKERIFK